MAVMTMVQSMTVNNSSSWMIAMMAKGMMVTMAVSKRGIIALINKCNSSIIEDSNRITSKWMVMNSSHTVSSKTMMAKRMMRMKMTCLR